MPDSPAERHRRLLIELSKQSLALADLQPDVRRDLEAEAADPTLPDSQKLVRPEMLAHLRALRADVTSRAALVNEGAGVAAASLSLFGSVDTVVVLPGIMGSTLSDLSSDGVGLIWFNPDVVFRDRLSLLQLGPFTDPEKDLAPNVDVEATGFIPIIYDLLRLDLAVGLRRYSVATFPIDWRKNSEVSAVRFRDQIKGIIANTSRPIHVVAHSQGALVARRGLQLLAQDLGPDAVRARLGSLVLLAPANYGSFSAAFALSGNYELLQKISPFVVMPSGGFQPVLQSMSGIYQLLPGNPTRLPVITQPDHQVGTAGFWPVVDSDRLTRFFGWGNQIDSTFFNDRTVVIMGDSNASGLTGTVTGAKFQDGVLKATHVGHGDGTVPDCFAYLDGVATFQIKNAEHLRLPTYPRVLSAVRDVLAGRPVATDDSFTSVSAADALNPGSPLPVPLAVGMASPSQ